jgi:hypothetical protein
VHSVSVGGDNKYLYFAALLAHQCDLPFVAGCAVRSTLAVMIACVRHLGFMSLVLDAFGTSHPSRAMMPQVVWMALAPDVPLLY